MLTRSASGVSRSSEASADFSTAVDSPVSAASATWRSRVATRRKSAGTLSPEASSTTSPGTSSVDGTRTVLPARTTVDSVTRLLDSASIARSALASCKYPIQALISTTPRMTPASTQPPMASLIPLAASRM